MTLAPSGEINLYAAGMLWQTASIAPLATDQWYTLRLSVTDGIAQVVVDNNPVIVIADPYNLPPGTISVGAVFPETSLQATPPIDTLLVDDFSVWIPLDTPATETPTSTTEASVTASLTPSPELTPTPTATPTEPALALLVSNDFNDSDVSAWTLDMGWSLTPSEEGQALQVLNSNAPISLIRLPDYSNGYSNVAVQARVFLANASAAEFNLWTTESIYYKVALTVSGEITVYRGDTTFTSTVIDSFDAAVWHTLRFSVVQGVVRVSVDGAEFVSVSDEALLPPGDIQINANFTTLAPENVTPPVNTLLVDDVMVWGISSSPITPTETETPETTAEATTKATAEATVETTPEMTAEATVESTAESTMEATEAAFAALNLTQEYTGMHFDIPSGDENGLADAIILAKTANLPITLDLYPGSIYSSIQSLDQQTSSDRNALPSFTIPFTLNGNGATLERDSDASVNFRILQITNSAYINNLTIAGGNLGAIRFSGSSYTLELFRTNLIGNFGTSYGVIDATNGSLQVDYSVFEGNGRLGSDGLPTGLAPIHLYFADATITNSTIIDNQARSGGGINIHRGNVEIRNSNISDNESVTGGAIYNERGEVTVQDTRITGNSASGRAGAVYYYAPQSEYIGSLSIAGSCIENNTTSTGYDVYSGTFSTWKAGVIVAINNWWGSASGPSGVNYSGSGDSVGDRVTATPFATAPLESCNLPANSDDDELIDTQEAEAGTSPTEEDTDGDGLIDSDEVYIYQTNPLEPDTDGDGFDDGEDNCPIYASSDQTNTDGGWMGDVCDPDDDNDGLFDEDELTIFNTDPLQRDTDGDGELDIYEDTDNDDSPIIQEFLLGTNPGNPDSDNDGILDGDEDKDGDGLSNGDEYIYGTNVSKSDTDGDRLNDSEEIHVYGTDPLNWDTDGDSLGDGAEVHPIASDPNIVPLDPLDPDFDDDGLTDYDDSKYANPVIPDADGDGLGDALEYEYRSKAAPYKLDPRDADTDNDNIPDGQENPDGDTLINLQEAVINSYLPISDTVNRLYLDKSDSNNNGILDQNEDPDGDGLTHLQELILGTNPFDQDSDSDGFSDAQDDDDSDGFNKLQEYNHGTDRLDPDTDGDEVEDGGDNCPTVSNPTQRDDDHDGQGTACEPTEVSPYYSQVLVDPVTGIALAGHPITLTVIVKAPDGQPMNNIPVQLSSLSTGLSIAAATGITDAQGRFTTTITSATPLDAVVNIVADGVPLGSAILQFERSDPSVSIEGLNHNLQAGRYAIYDITVSNNNPDNQRTAHNIWVTARFPIGVMTYDSEISPNDGVDLFSGSGGLAQWLIPELPYGETGQIQVVARIAGNLQASTQTSYSAIVEISADDDSNPLNNQATSQPFQMVNEPLDPGVLYQSGKLQVQVVPISAAPYRVGDQVTFEVRLTNNSGEPLYNIDGYTRLNSTGLKTRLIFDWPDPSHPYALLDDDPATATFSYTIPATYPYPSQGSTLNTNLVSIVADDAHPALQGSETPDHAVLVAVTDSLTGLEFPITGPRLVLNVETPDAPFTVGDLITFNVNISNLSTTDASPQLTITDSFTPGSQTIAPIAPGQTATATFTLQTQSPHHIPSVTNTFTVTGADIAPLTISSRVMVGGVTEGATANLYLDTSSFQTEFIPNDDTPLNVIVQNSGTFIDKAVTLRMPLPEGIEYVSLGPNNAMFAGYDSENRVLTYSWPSLGNTGVTVAPEVKASGVVGTPLIFDIRVFASDGTTVLAETNFDDNTAIIAAQIVARAATRARLEQVDPLPSLRNYLIADGQDSMTLKVTAIDQLGDVITDLGVHFTSEALGVSFDTATVVTDSEGEATITLHSTEMGPATITATFDDGAAVSFLLDRRAGAIQLVDTELTVGIGGIDALDFTVINTSAEGDNVYLEVTGLPSTWYQLMPPYLALSAGQFEDGQLMIAIPADACAAAGPYPFTIQATNSDGEILGMVESTLHVTVSPPALTEVFPAADAVVSSENVLFSWRSNTHPATGTGSGATVYIRQKVTAPETPLQYASFTLARNTTDSMLYTLDHELTPGTYEWYGEMAGPCDTISTGSAAEPHLLQVVPGVAFDARSYAYVVGDDYNQIIDVDGLPMQVIVRNDTTEPQKVYVAVDNPYPDLILGFVGMGSVNQPVEIPGHSSLSLPLRIFTQETTRDDYAFRVTLHEVDTNPNDVDFTDSVPVTIRIRRPSLDNVQLEVLNQNPTTLITTARLVNNGPAITDLNLDLVGIDGIPANFVIEPDIHHAYLPQGASVDITIIPLEILDENGNPVTPTSGRRNDSYALMSFSHKANFSPVNQTTGEIGGYSFRICYNDECDTRQDPDTPVTNQCPVDRQPTECDASGTYTSTSNAWYCTNRPNIDIRIRLPFQNLTQENILYTVLYADFGAPTLTYNHALNMSFNGTLVTSAIVPQDLLDEDTPAESEDLQMSIEVPNSSVATNGVQTIQIDSEHPYDNSAHYVWTNQISVEVEVQNYTRVECQTPEQISLASNEIPMCAAVSGFYSPANQENVCTATIAGNGSNINVRQTAGENGLAIGSLVIGTPVVVLGHSLTFNDWYLIRSETSVSGEPKQGWVWGQLLSSTSSCMTELPFVTDDGGLITPTPTPEPTPTPDPTVCTGYSTHPDSTNVRPGPSIESGEPTFTFGINGDVDNVEIISEYNINPSDIWYRVKSGNMFGYASAAYTRIEDRFGTPCSTLPLDNGLGTLVPRPTVDPDEIPCQLCAPEAQELYRYAAQLNLPEPFTHLPVDTDEWTWSQGYGMNTFAFEHWSIYDTTNHIHSGLDFGGSREDYAPGSHPDYPEDDCNPANTCIQLISVCNGTITSEGDSTGPDTGAGVTLRCDNPNNEPSNILVVYNHLDEHSLKDYAFPSAGQHFNAGDPLGVRVHQAPNVPDPHLHLEVFYSKSGSHAGNAIRIDPFLMFSSQLVSQITGSQWPYYPEDTVGGVLRYEWLDPETNDPPDVQNQDTRASYDSMSHEEMLTGTPDYDLGINPNDFNQWRPYGDISANVGQNQNHWVWTRIDGGGIQDIGTPGPEWFSQTDLILTIEDLIEVLLSLT